jgi:60 kDa SS-A/Ro ribonucleoprotein
MAKNYTQIFNPSQTPQTVQADPQQSPNNAGGFSFTVNKWQQLDRFLILGSTGGTFYVKEEKLTRDNANKVIELLKTDGVKAVERITEVSVKGLACKQEPAIFALALATMPEMPLEVRQKALHWALPLVCRTGTHLLMFVNMATQLRGMGKGLQKALLRWYKDKPVKQMVFQVTKYFSRAMEKEKPWSHADIFRLIRPASKGTKYGQFLYGSPDSLTFNTEQRNVVRWAVGKASTELVDMFKGTDLHLIWVHDQIRRMGEDASPKSVADFIREHKPPMEFILKPHLKHREVWEALLPHMPVMATIRNLGNLSKNGLLESLTDSQKMVCERLVNDEQLKRARIHPLFVLNALKTYSSGHGVMGKGEWQVWPQITEALNKAFYKSFEYVVPTGKNIFLGCDVSASMSAPMSAAPLLSCCEGVAAMAMQLARTEQNYFLSRFNTGIEPVKIGPTNSLENTLGYFRDINGGGTDCSLPMIYARQRKLKVDAFIVLTDSETYAGQVHPHEALKAYRESSGIKDAKLIVVGMVANPFTIANPNDPGMLDVVGYSTNTPKAISTFINPNVADSEVEE